MASFSGKLSPMPMGRLENMLRVLARDSFDSTTKQPIRSMMLHRFDDEAEFPTPQIGSIMYEIRFLVPKHCRSSSSRMFEGF